VFSSSQAAKRRLEKLVALACGSECNVVVYPFSFSANGGLPKAHRRTQNEKMSRRLAGNTLVYVCMHVWMHLAKLDPASLDQKGLIIFFFLDM